MSRKILFVVEGPTEKSELDNSFLKHLGISKDEYQICKYNTSIYELYDLLTNPINDDLSLSSILLTNKMINIEPNKQIDSTFSSVYLIFDFDPQYHLYSKDKIQYLANRFTNETEDGLLILNYPMFESILDIELKESIDDYSNKKIFVCKSNEYKKIVSSRTCFRKDEKHPYKHLYHIDDIIKCSNYNLKKYLKIINYSFYDGIQTKKLLDEQLNLLELEDNIYVLNTMVLLYFDYNSIPNDNN